MKKKLLVLSILLSLVLFNCKSKTSKTKVSVNKATEKIASSNSEKQEVSKPRKRIVDLPKTKSVNIDKFFKLNSQVNEKVYDSIRKPDNSPREDVQITEPVVLRGTIVTPEKIIKDGYILITYKQTEMQRLDKVEGFIKEIGNYDDKPSKYKVIDLTGNYIYPGFIELHNHIHYNIFDLWKPTYDIYSNRDVWPKTNRYNDWKKMKKYILDFKKMGAEATKFGEIKGLMGGNTAMQGYLNPRMKESYGLCRNIDNNGNMLYDGRSKVAGSVVGINKWWKGRPGSRTAEKTTRSRERFKERMDSTGFRYFIHLCEGIDDNIHKEFEKMVDFNLLNKHIIGIHSTALKGKDWEIMARAGASVVWSPLSNLILYNKTVPIKEALDSGFPFERLSFAPDWAPSGSPSMLFEAKVVNEYNQNKLNNLFTAKQIVEMMTRNPMIQLGYEKYIGTLEKGKRADITVLKIKDDDPYKSVIKTNNEDVNLVMVDGQPLYGQLEYFKKFDKGNDYEIFDVNGQTKAIDITDEALPDGKQTFKQLLKILLNVFKEVRKKIPFEFKGDKKDYCKLAPLFWPRYTSYKNIMYLCVAGKNSYYYSYRDNEKDKFENSDLYSTRNRDAKSEFNKLIGKKSKKRYKGKRGRYKKRGKYKKSYKKSKLDKSMKGKKKIVTTIGVGKLGDAFCKIDGVKTYIKGYSKVGDKIEIEITGVARSVYIAKFIKKVE